MALSLRPTLFLSGATQEEMTPANVILYEVHGLPSNMHALIRRKEGHWQILRVKGSTPGAWAGEYQTPETALEAIASELTRRPRTAVLHRQAQAPPPNPE